MWRRGGAARTLALVLLLAAAPGVRAQSSFFSSLFRSSGDAPADADDAPHDATPPLADVERAAAPSDAEPRMRRRTRPRRPRTRSRR